MGKMSRLGNDLYEGRVSINFVGRRWMWYGISAVVIVLAVLGLSVRGVNLGIDFTGGAEYRVTLPANQVNQDTADEVRDAVANAGIESASNPIVNTSGSEAILVQVESVEGAESEELVDTLVDITGADASADISQSEIGPSWGDRVAKRALIGIGVFLVLVMFFIWAYFREWKMSAAALVALGHDVLITVGIYAWSGFEVSPATVTGVLTILGYSLYDTVVVFDKVRENTQAMSERKQSYSQAANLAVNQTLWRSINTSVVALLPVGSILYVAAVQLGSGNLKDLSLALFVGMAAGTYSSVCIATPLLVHLKQAEKEVELGERRAAARLRKADRYAEVGAAHEFAEIGADGKPGLGALQEQRATTRRSSSTGEKRGAGRTVPEPHSPVEESKAANRAQPKRQTRSQRGKKR